MPRAVNFSKVYLIGGLVAAAAFPLLAFGQAAPVTLTADTTTVASGSPVNFLIQGPAATASITFTLTCPGGVTALPSSAGQDICNTSQSLLGGSASYGVIFKKTVSGDQAVHATAEAFDASFHSLGKATIEVVVTDASAGNTPPNSTSTPQGPLRRLFSLLAGLLKNLFGRGGRQTQFSDFEVATLPSPTIPPTSFDIVHRDPSLCRDFGSDGQGQGDVFPCPPDLHGELVVSSSTETRYTVNVSSETQVLDRTKKPLGLSEISLGDKVNVYGTADASGTIAAQIVRDLSKPEQPVKSSSTGPLGGFFERLFGRGSASSTPPAASSTLGLPFLRTQPSQPPPPPPQTPSITVLSPNGAEVWQKGTTQTIRWQSSGDVPNVRIDLLKGVSVIRNIGFTANTVGAVNSMLWTVPADVADGADYAVLIASVHVSADSCRVLAGATPPLNCVRSPVAEVSDQSNAPFSIVAATSTATSTPTIASVAPASVVFGDTTTQIKAVGTSFTSADNTVKFASASADGKSFYVNNLRSPDGTSLQFTLAGVSLCAPGAVCALLLQTLPVGNYALYIMNANGASNSMNFTVTPAAEPNAGITVLSPNGGEDWAAGTYQIIKWSGGSSDSKIGIYLDKASDSSQAAVIVQTGNTGNYGWNVPTTLSAGNYLVKVCTLALVNNDLAPNQCDSSDAPFSIVPAPSATAPHILKIVPDSGSIGAMVTVFGSGFTPTGNSLKFSYIGIGYLNNLTSADGTTIVFAVPFALSACGPGAYCNQYFPPPAVKLQPGNYLVSATNVNGTSNFGSFTVTSGGIYCDPRVSIYCNQY